MSCGLLTLEWQCVNHLAMFRNGGVTKVCYCRANYCGRDAWVNAGIEVVMYALQFTTRDL